MPSVPIVGGKKNPQSPEEFDKQRSNLIASYQKELDNIKRMAQYNFATNSHEIPFHLLNKYDVLLKQLNAVLNATYQPMIGGSIGPSCIFTATDNYGSEYLLCSNKVFMQQPASISGFTKVTNSNVQQGDIVIRSENNGNHAMIYAGKDAIGPVYNHSNGGTQQDDYRHNAHYPATDDQLSTYRFTGTHNDSLLWKKEYANLKNKLKNK